MNRNMLGNTRNTLETKYRKIYDITNNVNEIIKNKKIIHGICNIFCQHTSCSLIFCFCSSYEDDDCLYFNDFFALDTILTY